jgi:hypothetical protein
MNKIKQTIILLVFVPQVMFAGTIVVDQSGSGDYTTIGAAISASSSGDTVLVNPGYYVESIMMPDHLLYLIGKNRVTTTITSSTEQIKFDRHDYASVVEGFTLAGSGSNKGIYAYMGNSTPEKIVRNCIIKSSSRGIYNEGAKLQVRNCLITENTWGLFTQNSGNGTINLYNSIVYNNSDGIASDEGDVFVLNSIIYNNSGSGMSGDGQGSLSSQYSNFYGNGSVDGKNWSDNATSGTGDISIDPKFNDISQGYSISSTSPCLNTGNPATVFNDPDGTRNDMGLYGGPFTWSAGPVVSALSISSASVVQGTSITITATAKSK